MEGNKNLTFAFIVDNQGFIVNSIAFDNQKPSNAVVEGLPLGLYKPKWDGDQWIEGATQNEIAEIKKLHEPRLSDNELLGQQMTERELESMQQGQQITDLELRLLNIEKGTQPK